MTIFLLKLQGDTVAVFAGNSLDYPVIMLSLLNLGVTVTQGSPTSTEQDIRYHLLDSGKTLVFIVLTP